MKKSEQRRLRAIWLAVFVVFVAAASLLLIWPRHIVARHHALEERLETAIAHLARRSWERPPLRDETRPGNAVEASMHASVGFADLPLVGTPELDAALRTGVVPDALEPILAEQSDRLRRFEESTLRTFSRRVGSFESAPDPHLRDRRAGVQLLLASALGEPPVRCGERVAAAVRIAQDASAGGGLEEAAHAASEIDLALDVLPRCFENATEEALDELAPSVSPLADTFRLLAEHPVPIGYALEHAALMQALAVSRKTAPGESAFDVFDVRTTLERPAQLKAFEQILDVAESLSQLERYDYPALLSEAISRFEELPIGVEPDLGRRIDAFVVLRRHGESVARLRAAAVALHDLAVPAEGGPPAWSREPSLVDPFDGAPLRHRIDGETLVVWSVGHDGIDHHGSRELRVGDVPADVVFALRTRRRPEDLPSAPSEDGDREPTSTDGSG